MQKNLSSLPEQEPRDTAEFPEPLSDANIKSLLAEKLIALRQLDKQVTELLKTEHSSADTQSLKDEAVNLDRELTDLSDLLDDRIKESSADDKEKREFQIGLRNDCANLIARDEKLGRKLSDDMIVCLSREAKAPIDLIKVATFVVAFPAAASTLAKALWGDKAPEVNEAAEAGIVLGVGVAFSKQIGNAWKAAASVVCQTPEQIRNSFLLYYVKEIAREKTKATLALFAPSAATITQKVAKIPARTHRLMSRLFASKKAP